MPEKPHFTHVKKNHKIHSHCRIKTRLKQQPALYPKHGNPRQQKLAIFWASVGAWIAACALVVVSSLDEWEVHRACNNE